MRPVIPNAPAHLRPAELARGLSAGMGRRCWSPNRRTSKRPIAVGPTWSNGGAQAWVSGLSWPTGLVPPTGRHLQAATARQIVHDERQGSDSRPAKADRRRPVRWRLQGAVLVHCPVPDRVTLARLQPARGNSPVTPLTTGPPSRMKPERCPVGLADSAHTSGGSLARSSTSSTSFARNRNLRPRSSGDMKQGKRRISSLDPVRRGDHPPNGRTGPRPSPSAIRSCVRTHFL